MTLLDAYAVIGFLAGEPVADEVESLVRRGECRMTTLGPAEVIDRMARLYVADPDEISVDIATLGLRAPAPLDITTSTLAGRLRARHYDRTTRAVSMADCVLAAEAQLTNESLATSDPRLLDLCDDEGIPVIPLPGSDGSVWSPT